MFRVLLAILPHFTNKLALGAQYEHLAAHRHSALFEFYRWASYSTDVQGH
jgi:hypothetical protein